MFHRWPAHILRLLAAMAVLGVLGHACAGPLEHIGAIAHEASAAADAAAPVSVPVDAGHHHHLADLGLPAVPAALPPVAETAAALSASTPLPPEAPVSGIEHPPRRA